jgi:CSLREA domain-containing protein
MNHGKLFVRAAAAVVGALIVVPLVFVAPAAAATIVVNTLDDEDNVDGDCSLREAVRAANTDSAVDACAAGSGADLIIVPSGTIVLSHPDEQIFITDQVTIRGAGQTLTIIDNIDHAGFRVTGPGATFEDLRVIDSAGRAIDGDDPGQTITLTRVGLIGNGNDGLEMHENGTVTVTDSTISANEGDGLDLDDSTTVTITGSTISDNERSGVDGGDDSGVTITGSSISGNGRDGADFDGGTVTVSGSTFSGNGFGPESEGGDGIDASGGLTVVNSTVSGNATDGIDSGAGEVTVLNSTVALNGSHGVDGDDETPITLTNTIVAGNDGDDCADEVTITSGGGNIDLDGTCGLDQASDQPSTEPMLGALADNGGPTLTHLPADDSPAVDMALDGPCPATDQRGASRPFDGDLDGTANCDVGAVEVGATVPVTSEPSAPSAPNAPPGPLTGAPAAQAVSASPRLTG